MKFDTTFPRPHQSERIAQALINSDNFLQDVLWSKLIQNGKPYRWTRGKELESQEGTPDQFENQIWYHINKEYKIGTGTIYAVHTEGTYHINYVHLGNGYKINCYSFDPHRFVRKETSVFLLDFLYQEPNHPKSNDGTLRLKKFIRYMNQAPSNPYSFMLMHPAGDEISNLSPVMISHNYRRTNHSSADLTKIYKRHLKIEPTNLIADNFEGVKTPYYRVGIYDPIDPIIPRSECPFNELLEDGECPFDYN